MILQALENKEALQVEDTHSKEEYYRGLPLDVVKGMNMQIGRSYTINIVNSASKTSEWCLVIITGVFFDGYSFVRLEQQGEKQ